MVAGADLRGDEDGEESTKKMEKVLRRGTF